MAASQYSTSTSCNPLQQRSPSGNPPPISSSDEILMLADKKAFPRSMEIQDDAEDKEHLMADSNRSSQTCFEARDVEELESSIREKLFQTYLPPPSRCSIFRVPNMLRRHNNEKAFVPEVVSIGPFHRENEQLQAMEIIKLRYLKCLLYRTRTTELKSLVEAIQSIEQDCRECYAEVVDLSRKKFIEMMLIDGCFILEFLYRYQARDEGRHAELRSMDRYFWEISMELKGGDDPVFKTSWMPRKIVEDLLLLENQLPWCVLFCLFNLMTNSTTTEYQKSLLDLVAIPFSTEYRIFYYAQRDRLNRLGPHKHLLDCFRNHLVGSCNITRPSAARSVQPEGAPFLSVMKFLNFGVGFSLQDGGNFLDVKFEDGKMKMAAIVIEENTESLFKNLIAFEHCDPSKGYEITSYASLLNCLIKSPKDAVHLRRKYILLSGSSNEDIASFLNRLLYNDARFHGFLYADLADRVIKFCLQRRRYWRAIVRRDYIREPSAFITFLCGVVLSLILSIIQTGFAILSYIPSKSAK